MKPVMKVNRRGYRFTIDITGWCLILALLSCISAPAHAQQFNTDNYWTAPHGVETSTLTVGQNYNFMMITAALFPQWEVNLGSTLYKNDETLNRTDNYSATAYVKYMGYENEAKNGGWGIMAGMGREGGYFESGNIVRNQNSYWAYAPFTLPFRDGDVSWDIMPGFVYNRKNAGTEDSAFGWTYSSRLAVYGIIPQSAIVGEVFGVEGDVQADAKYRLGVRWESKYVIIAVTYSDAFTDAGGAGIEVGAMILSPAFLCFGGC